MTDARADVDPIIREATLADAAALASLMGELGYPTSEAEMKQRLETILADSGFKTFVAVVGDQVCGMIGTLIQPSYEHNDWSGRIVAMVVSKAMRRRGLARQLILEAEKDFARRNVKRISLTTRLTRLDAHKFYEQLDYERTGYRYAKSLAESVNRPPASDSRAR